MKDEKLEELCKEILEISKKHNIKIVTAKAPVYPDIERSIMCIDSIWRVKND